MGDEGQMTISVQQWLQLGETVFEREVSEYRALQARLDETEAEVAAKLEGLHLIAQALGKITPEGTPRITAVVVDAPAEPPRRARHAARALAARLASPIFMPAFAGGGR